MLDPVLVAAAPRPNELSAAALKVRRWKRKTLRRACQDQEAVLNRAYDARRVGDVANFEKDLREVLSRGTCLATPSSAIAAHELALFRCQGGGGAHSATDAIADRSSALTKDRIQRFEGVSSECQAEADRLLASLGFGFRLSPQILNYSERLEFASAVAPSRKRKSSSRGEASVTPPTSGKGLAAAFDHVLEANLLADLRYAFRGDSLFWVDHEYPTDAFFSYNYPIPGRDGRKTLKSGASSPLILPSPRAAQEISSDKEEESSNGSSDGHGDGGGGVVNDDGEAERSLRFREEHSWLGDGTQGGNEHCIARLVAALQPIIAKHFPAVAASATSVEWWAHRRNELGAGHQLHYDLDELRLKGQETINANDQEEEEEEGVEEKTESEGRGRSSGSAVKSGRTRSSQFGKESGGSGGSGSVHCPLLSCVLYLEPGPNNPTVVTDHALPGVCRSGGTVSNKDPSRHGANASFNDEGGASAGGGNGQKRARRSSAATTTSSSRDKEEANSCEDAISAPTSTTTPPGPAEEAQGWLCFPASNRLLCFDGALLHGVVPPKATTATDSCSAAEAAGTGDSCSLPVLPPPRVTVMLGWWGPGVALSAAPEALPSADLSYYAGPPPFAGGTPVTAAESLAKLLLPQEGTTADGSDDDDDDGDDDGGDREDRRGAGFDVSEIIASSDEELLAQGAMAAFPSSEEDEEEDDDDDEGEEAEEEEDEEEEVVDGVFECEFDCGLRGSRSEVEAHELTATTATCRGLARLERKHMRKAGLLTTSGNGDEDDSEANNDDDDEEEEEEEAEEEEEEEGAEAEEELVLGPNMPMKRAFRWLDEEFLGAHLLHHDSHRRRDDAASSGTPSQATAAAAAAARTGPTVVSLQHVPRVWAPVGAPTKEPNSNSSTGRDEVKFVGRWFVAHPAEIDKEVLAARAPAMPSTGTGPGNGAVPAEPEFMSIADALAASK